MRVYLPATFADLEQIAAGLFAPEHGFAVTHRMLDISSLDDEEEIAEQVRDAAGMASAIELGSPLRVVVVADHPRADVEELSGGHPAAVAISGRVGLEEIACVFIDEPGAADAVVAARADEEGRVRLEGHDLLWWGPGELAAVPGPALS